MKFSIITLGCKVNAYESNFMKESLEKKGFSFCDDYFKSDIIIINTCTVTDTSDKKSYKLIRRVRRENNKAIMVVCGCSSQNNPEVYKNLNLDIVIGNKEKSKIVNIIENFINNKIPYFYVDSNRDVPFENMMIENFNHVRAYIKIQDGCNNFCSYCIIPFVRGTVRCKDYNEILKECCILASKGFKEIVLTGIHTGMYNYDGKDLTDLINDISNIKGIERVRLSSVEITELNDKFLNMLKENKTFCNHLHVPLQTGCDKMLKVMNRKYDLEFYENKIKEIRNIRPDISITTDVIVGHNKETEEDFNNTFEFCKKINFAKIHVFPYSKRTGTKSSFMDEEVSEKDKKERTKRLIELSNNLEKEYYNNFIGSKLDVLVETIKDGKSYGHTSNYLYVTLDEILEAGKIYIREIK